MKLLNVRKRGVFVKAICAYMFGNEEPKIAHLAKEYEQKYGKIP